MCWTITFECMSSECILTPRHLVTTKFIIVCEPLLEASNPTGNQTPSRLYNDATAIIPTTPPSISSGVRPITQSSHVHVSSMDIHPRRLGYYDASSRHSGSHPNTHYPGAHHIQHDDYPFVSSGRFHSHHAGGDMGLVFRSSPASAARTRDGNAYLSSRARRSSLAAGVSSSSFDSVAGLSSLPSSWGLDSDSYSNSVPHVGVYVPSSESDSDSDSDSDLNYVDEELPIPTTITTTSAAAAPVAAAGRFVLTGGDDDEDAEQEHPHCDEEDCIPLGHFGSTRVNGPCAYCDWGLGFEFSQDEIEPVVTIISRRDGYIAELVRILTSP